MAAAEADARSAFIGREELSALAPSNVEVRDCLSSAIGMDNLMALTQRDPTTEEMALITPCLPEKTVAETDSTNATVIAEIEPTQSPQPV